MALYRMRDSGFLNGRVAVMACLGLAVSVPLNSFILLFPLFGSYLVIYLAFAPWLKPFPAARYGDLSYGLYIYGWPIEQSIAWLNGGAMAWWALFAIAFPVTAAFALLSWHLVEKRALRFKPRAAASARGKLAESVPSP
jgi:peptidoglycan/LPS O-acetylase OafA/YrhL